MSDGDEMDGVTSHKDEPGAGAGVLASMDVILEECLPLFQKAVDQIHALGRLNYEPGYKSTSADKAEQMVALVDAMLGKRPVSTTIMQVRPKHAMSQMTWSTWAMFDSDAHLRLWRQYHPPIREMAFRPSYQFLTLRSALWKAVS